MSYCPHEYAHNKARHVAKNNAKDATTWQTRPMNVRHEYGLPCVIIVDLHGHTASTVHIAIYSGEYIRSVNIYVNATWIYTV